MNKKNQRSDKMSSLFLELGCQYFAIARYCSSIFFMPIGATMFHHAIEMLIKGYLIRSYSSYELKKVGHDLNKLWGMFKSASSDSSLSRFDKSISELNRVELLRYPDLMVDEGFELTVKSGNATPESSPQPQYYILVSDLDDLALSILNICKVNPKACFKNIPTDLRTALPSSFRS